MKKFLNLKITVIHKWQSIKNYTSLSTTSDKPYHQFDVAVVLDILRCTSTITAAINNGCNSLIPAYSITEALNIASTKSNTLLAGEKNTNKPTKFHLGNSPLEYTADKVKNKNIIIATTNGTKSIIETAKIAHTILIGSMLTADAIAKYLAFSNKNIVFVRVGTKGNFALEYVLASGYIIQKILLLNNNIVYNSKKLNKNLKNYNKLIFNKCKRKILEIDDMAITCCKLAYHYKNNIMSAFCKSTSGKKLIYSGKIKDLFFCVNLNAYNKLIHYTGSCIKIMANP